MKRKATPEQIAAAQAHIRRWETPRTPAEDIQMRMRMKGWADPQLVTIDNTVYVAAITGSATVFIKGEGGAYEVMIAGNDTAVSADLQLPRIPNPGVICEVWRLLNVRELL
jgi:hypothetical protein